jgi:hypothetical protein
MRRFEVLKKFTLKESGQTRTFLPGVFIDLDDLKSARLLQAGVIAEADTDSGRMQDEYFTLLKRSFELNYDPAATMEEARRIVTRLGILYQELHAAGCKVPVRLPVQCGPHSDTAGARKNHLQGQRH